MSLGGHHGAKFAPTRREVLHLAAILGVSLVAPQAGAAATPVLTSADLDVLGQVADLIIPATDTGGATQAGVPAFIQMMVEQWFDDLERDNFLAGMKAFAAGTVTRYGRTFERLTPVQKSEYFGALLTEAEMKASAPFSLVADADQRPRSPFVVLMKRLTIVGYYTSELGATAELSYAMVPEEHVACGTPMEHPESSATYFALPFEAR